MKIKPDDGKQKSMPYLSQSEDSEHSLAMLAGGVFVAFICQFFFYNGADGHFGFTPLEKNAGIFARDTGAKYFLKGSKKSNQSSKHLSQKVVMKARFFTLLIGGVLSCPRLHSKQPRLHFITHYYYKALLLIHVRCSDALLTMYYSINTLAAKLLNWNVHPLEVVSRDLQLQVGENHPVWQNRGWEFKILLIYVTVYLSSSSSSKSLLYVIFRHKWSFKWHYNTIKTL